jgi:hypothetical protein
MVNKLFSDIPDILGLLGVDKSTHQLYGVSKDRYVIKSMNPAGGNWQYIKRSEWNEVKWKPSVVKMTTLSWVAQQDGVPEDVLMTLLDSNTDQWKGTRLSKKILNSALRYNTACFIQ